MDRVLRTLCFRQLRTAVASAIETRRNKVPDLLKSSFLIRTQDQIRKRLQQSLGWIHLSTEMLTSSGKAGVLGVTAQFFKQSYRR
jgi:hypothetical protein